MTHGVFGNKRVYTSCRLCPFLQYNRESAGRRAEPPEEKLVASQDYRRATPPNDISLTPTKSRRPLCPLTPTESPRSRSSQRKVCSTTYPDTENDYPFLNPYTNAASTPACNHNSATQTMSYAEAARLRSKRGVGDRECMSPLDVATKKPLFCASPELCLQTALGVTLTETTPGFIER